MRGVMAEDPRTWAAPAGPWHPNFDPAVEVEMLRAFALRLIGRYPRYGVRLVVTEPGYMHVEVVDDGRGVASVLISRNSDDGGRWYYQYNLAGEGSGGLELEFGAEGMEGAVEELRRFATGHDGGGPVKGRALRDGDDSAR